MWSTASMTLPPFSHQILTDFEERARNLGLNFSKICRQADIAYSTYARWRKGQTDPLRSISKIDAVLRHHEEQNNR